MLICICEFFLFSFSALLPFEKLNNKRISLVINIFVEKLKMHRRPFKDNYNNKSNNTILEKFLMLRFRHKYVKKKRNISRPILFFCFFSSLFENGLEWSFVKCFSSFSKFQFGRFLWFQNLGKNCLLKRFSACKFVRTEFSNRECWRQYNPKAGILNVTICN